MTINQGRRPPRKGQRWSGPELEALAQMTADDLRAEEIANRLDRSVASIFQRQQVERNKGRGSFTCSRCRQTQPAENYSAGMRYPGGRCLACSRAYNAERKAS